MVSKECWEELEGEVVEGSITGDVLALSEMEMDRGNLLVPG